MRFLILAMIALLIPVGGCKEERQAEVNEPRIVDEREYDIIEGQRYYGSDDWQNDNMFRGLDHVYIVYRSTRPNTTIEIPEILQDDVIIPMLTEILTRRYKVDKPADGAIRHPQTFDLRNQQVTLIDLRDSELRKKFEEEIFPDPKNLYVFYERQPWIFSEKGAPGLNTTNLTILYVQMSRGTEFIFDSIDGSITIPIQHDSITEDTLPRIRNEFNKMIK